MPETRFSNDNIGGSFDDVEVVLADDGVFAPFVEHSIVEYRRGLETAIAGDVPLHRPNSWGLLGGTLEGDAMVVKRFAFATNVRANGPAPVEEFRENIVPKFGKQYDDEQRGFWCDPYELLKIVREFEDAGLEMLGSIHMHPDWHRVGPAHERGTQKLSEKPSKMDEYLFRNAGWPLNIICYLESREDGITHTYAAWRPSAHEETNALEMTIRFFVNALGG